MPTVAPHGQTQEDWKILRALRKMRGFILPYDTPLEVRATLAEAETRFARVVVAGDIHAAFSCTSSFTKIQPRSVSDDDEAFFTVDSEVSE